MTLVVGEIVAGGPVLWADSALRREHDPRSDFFRMGLKLVVLHPGLCVAYAGGAEDALRTILDLGVDRHTGYDIDDVHDRLLAAHVSTNEATDFLIASLIPVPALIRVFGGEAIDLRRTFVGLPSAYAAYHDQYDTSGQSIAEVGERMDRAMETLIEDQAVEDVGGTSIGVAPGDGGFEYRPPWATIASTSAVEISGGAPAGTYLLPIPKTAAEGGYRFVFAVPEDAGIGALAMYFQPGDLGLLLYPMADLYPIPFTGVSQQEFAKHVMDQHGVRLRFHGTLDPDW